MKILQVGKFYPIRGGVEKVMYDMMLGLSQRGVSCDMLCAAVENQQPGVVSLNENARLIIMPAIIKCAATMISPAMISALRRIKDDYDVIHIHHPDPMACVALFFSGYKGKVLLHWHSDILKQKILLKIYHPFQKWLIDRADLIIGTTPVYVSRSPFLKNVQYKVGHIPIGVDRIIPDNDAMRQIRSCYAGKRIVFSLGRLVEYKGYEYLIKAARYLTDDYVILIGGTGPLKEELQALIKEEGQENKVRLIGYVSDDELPHYFGACDLFCLSSIQKTEAFAIVQIEAMSVGKPVIATKIKDSGVSWVNAHTASGFNVEPQNAHAIAEAIEAVLSDNQVYRRLSEGALERYDNLFTKDTMVDLCLSIYEKILQ